MQIPFPLLEKEGWMRRMKRGADGVVSSAELTTPSLALLAPPLLFKEGKSCYIRHTFPTSSLGVHYASSQSSGLLLDLHGNGACVCSRVCGQCGNLRQRCRSDSSGAMPGVPSQGIDRADVA